MERNEYTVGWICALSDELAASRAMLDKEHAAFEEQVSQDDNIYSLGEIGGHKVVMACLPAGRYGIDSAATVARDMTRSFPSIKFGLMVGIGGGVPSKNHDIRLGDVVVSMPAKEHGGVINYEMGKVLPGGGFEKKGHLNKPPQVLLNAVSDLKATHKLDAPKVGFYITEALSKRPRLRAEYTRPGAERDRLFEDECQQPLPCGECQVCLDPQEVRRTSRISHDGEIDLSPNVHYGLIGSGNKVVASAKDRDVLCAKDDILCFEMEAAGLMDSFPCLVIRGVSDYADSYKRDEWQPYAATAASAYAKELLMTIPRAKVVDMQDARLTSGIEKADYELGLNLTDAPEIDDTLFVGRIADLQFLEKHLLPPQNDGLGQRCVVTTGLGGIGKSQLAIRFAKQNHKAFSSIFWLKAHTESALRQAMIDIARRMRTKPRALPDAVDRSEEDEFIELARLWLSRSENARWLLIFDNYDDPALPGRDSSTAYDIKKYFPYRSHGSILVTTQSSRVEFGTRLRLEKLNSIEAGIDVLAKRSGRENVNDDADARKLALRLDGLPIALTTAGDYLRNVPWTFAKYLQAYEDSWSSLEAVAEQLPDYVGRTLYSTWNLSLERVAKGFPEAAKLMQFLAYFDNQEIWFELLQSVNNKGPEWLRAAVGDEIRFAATMQKLQDYSLLEVHHNRGNYGMHSCVHDWALEYLNRTADGELYSLSIYCVASLAVWEDEDKYWQTDLRLEPHAIRIGHSRLIELLRKQKEVEHLRNTFKIAALLTRRDKLPIAKLMYQHILAGYEKALGLNHISTLDTVSDLGILLKNQGKLDEAEQMSQRALSGYEKVLGSDHKLTLDTVHNLGVLFVDQGKLDKAEQMYQRAILGCEKALGSDHTSTLRTVHNLGLLFRAQGKLGEAEQMNRRVLEGFEKSLGTDHTATLNTVNTLGVLFKDQGKLVEAEHMYKRALSGREKALGADHTSTLMTVNNLGGLFSDQGRLDEANQMFQRALSGFEKALGPNHTSTLTTINSLGLLFKDQGKLVEAEQMYRRALSGREKALGADHTATLNTVHSLGLLFNDQDKLYEAEHMYQRALSGREKVLGPDHKLTLDTVHNLGVVFRAQSRLDEAEQMYQRALSGYEKSLGPEHTATLNTVNNLGVLFRVQGKLDEAEQMCKRALSGREKALGPDHKATLNTIHHLGILFRAQGKLDKAEQMYKRALSGQEKALGADHTATLMTVNNLGDLYQDQIRQLALYNSNRDRTDRFTHKGNKTTLLQYYFRSLLILCESFRQSTNIIGLLGRSLVWLDSSIDAQIAFQLQNLLRQDGSLVLLGVKCDLCSSTIDPLVGRYVCRSCSDVDLCKSCYGKYCRIEASILGCICHDFFAVISQNTSVLDDAGRRAWFENLKNMPPPRRPAKSVQAQIEKEDTGVDILETESVWFQVSI